MSKKQFYSETELGALAKSLRLKAGKKKVEFARELGVLRSTIQLAEEYPEQSLTNVRIRMIENCSPFKVVGPVYFLKRK